MMVVVGIIGGVALFVLVGLIAILVTTPTRQRNEARRALLQELGEEPPTRMEMRAEAARVLPHLEEEHLEVLTRISAGGGAATFRMRATVETSELWGRRTRSDVVDTEDASLLQVLKGYFLVERCLPLEGGREKWGFLDETKDLVEGRLRDGVEARQ